MKISHRNIETVWNDPVGWARAQHSGDKPFVRKGYDGCVKEAIYDYHKYDDASIARASLARKLKNFKDEKRKLESAEKLDSYIDWCIQNDVIAADCKSRISLDLQYGNELSGEVSRVDVMPSAGYRGVLLGVIVDDWDDSIQLPLLQLALSEKYKRNIENISVGTQDITGDRLQTHVFDVDEIQDALDLAVEISRKVTSEFQKLSKRNR